MVTGQDPRRLSQNKAPAESSACLLSVENLSSKNKLGDFLGGPVGEDSELPLQGTQVWSWLGNENPTCLRRGQKIKSKNFFKRINLITEVKKMQKAKENSQTSQNNNTSAIRQSQGPLFSSSSRSIDIVLCLIWELFSRYSNPTKWRKLTVCCPEASQPQTTWKQKVDDAAFSLPHHRPWVGKQCETPHYHHQAGTHSLKALPAVALFAWPNSKANFFLLHPTLP